MTNPRLATRYAKSLITLAIERNVLEETYKDIEFLHSISKANPEFALVLKSPIIAPEKKVVILESVTKGNISELTSSFMKLLIKKGRETNLYEITTSFIDQFKQHKEIHTVKLVTASPVSDELKEEIVNQVRSQTSMKNIELNATVDESLIGGFVLQIGDTLVDASISYDLNVIRKQFLNNDFIYKIR
ncbi:MAG: ATP synthase F1 subunit delta [Proteobacteria bacterium]|nr:MAG: ATP synthase F1 subunit delta [Pseudomonadota bacterium]